MTSPANENALYHRLMTKGRLRQMQMITTVAELGNVNKAASRLGITQPAITKSIAEFETDIGLAIFERHSKGMRLTPAGKDILILLRRIQETTRFCADIAAAHRNNSSSIVRVASVSAGVSGLLAPSMTIFAAVHPRVTVNVLEVDGSDLGVLTQWDQQDVVICREPTDHATNLSFDTLLADRHIVVAPRHHALAKKRRVSLNDLLTHEWLLPPPGVPGKEILDELLGERARYCRIRSRSLPLAMALLTQSSLLTLVPQTLCRPMIDAGWAVEVKFELDSVLRPLGLLYPSDGLGSATQTFIAFLRNWAAHDHGVEGTRKR